MIGEKTGLEKVEGERKEGQRLFIHNVIHSGEVRVWRKWAEGMKRIPSSLLISSHFLAKRFFFSKVCIDYPIIFSGIEICMVRAQALAKAIFALANA
jgi:hypothetical protein